MVSVLGGIHLVKDGAVLFSRCVWVNLLPAIHLRIWKGNFSQSEENMVNLQNPDTESWAWDGDRDTKPAFSSPCGFPPCQRTNLPILQTASFWLCECIQHCYKDHQQMGGGGTARVTRKRENATAEEEDGGLTSC